MAENSAIEWTTHTFNPWRGCTKVSAGCAHCYAETMSGRNPMTLGMWGPNGTRVVASESMWKQPFKWNRDACTCYPRSGTGSMEAFKYCPTHRPDGGCRPRVFCASLADVFEDWAGPMMDARGKQLYHPRDTGIQYGESFPCDPFTMQDVRARLFELIDATPNLDWLLLTKRPENILRMMPAYSYHACATGDCPHDTTKDCASPLEQQFRENIWLGTSCENQAAADERIPHLLRTPAAVRFLSCEPLLGPVDLSVIHLRRNGQNPNELSNALGDWVSPLSGAFRNSPRISWVIVGGESGPGSRACRVDWIRGIVEQCKAASVPVFVKQLGGNPRELGDAIGETGFQAVPSLKLRDRKGGDMDEWEEGLRVRQFPESPVPAC